MASPVQFQRDISSPSSPSSTYTASSPTSSTCSNSSHCKSVQFSRFVKISFTYPSDEYDRSAIEPAKLTLTETSELLQLRSDWQQELDERQKEALLDRNDDGYGGSNGVCHMNRREHSASPPSSPSSSPCYLSSFPEWMPLPPPELQSNHSCRSRIHTHSLLQPSSTCSHASPPCSPVLSHHDSCSSSSSDDDEYDAALSRPQSRPSLTPQQQQQYQRLKRFGGSRNGMMHRHSHFDRSKENVECLA
ncbi:hypothetical protein EDD21DRAFT_198130 [Dissophora ornata]|nr:hypothetical protein EDD21DRAFT_198130 [Dissophora ornata]